MSFINASKKVESQIIDFSDFVDGKKSAWCLTIEDVIDVFDIAENIYSKVKGTCSEKLFIMINALEWGFDVDEQEVWKALSDVVRWNPWIEELKNIYFEEFIRQDRIGLKEKYDKMNERIRRRK